MFALLVPSYCDKSGTSCYHLYYKVDDGNRLVCYKLFQQDSDTSCSRNRLLRACCRQIVNNLLRTDDIRLAATTCCECVGIINLVTR